MKASLSSDLLEGVRIATSFFSVQESCAQENCASRPGILYRHTGGRHESHYFTRVIMPHAIGNVTCAGIGPSEATDAWSLLAAGMP
jgi:hypothetical protein